MHAPLVVYLNTTFPRTVWVVVIADAYTTYEGCSMGCSKREVAEIGRITGS